MELESTPTILSGEFTAHSYAAYLQSAGTSPGSTETTLNLYGFRDGYAREWEQRGSQNILVERVFEFGDERGAGYWYSGLKGQARVLSEYRSDVHMSIPNSFGAAFLFSGGRQQWRAEFWKGNLMFVVHTDADSDDLATLAVQQATTEYDNAPASTVSTAKAGNSLLPSWILVAGAAGVALVIVIAIVVVIAVTRSSAGWKPATYRNVQVSPDGRWWWDGQAWRPIPPPG